jgi:DNA replication protein DnaC
VLDEQTYDKLVAMKLHGVAAAWKQYLDEKESDSLTFGERFGMMVDQEWASRLERKIKNRLATAKLREEACVEDIDYRHPRKLDRSVMQKLSTCQWLRSHENVIITGATGLGKTWLACALANKACREGWSAVYVRLPRLMHTLAVARADGSYVRELTKLAKVHVLIMDDLGLVPIGDDERHDLLEILEDRYGVRSTIVTSQLKVKKWHEAIGDPTIADAILERIVHNAHRIDLEGTSMRDPKQRKGAGVKE